ncbi:pre-mrna-splicing factor slu7 [Phaffia rhodozyma]|uniref:Pre-mRNA-splicing factor SLU7 n=1 Tax=Phaffia rhodozyma TaxID=264483 RepID=A0A0F7SKX3_PHARH|nr:pre-mrna-splicing factor slu7 [Phaffia rhodozyma]
MSAAGKLSREEWRRQKDLEAARKAGTVPAEVDEEGRAINPHIPEYITKAPWYLDTGRPSLNHQRRPEYDSSSSKLDSWYDRGQTAGPAATKYRKGACENCGAMTHKTKDCVERPRKKGAKFTNKDIVPDEVIQNVGGDWVTKRDRWNGYDPSEYQKVHEEWDALEEARKRIREEEIDNQTTTDLAAVKKVAKAGKTKVKADDDFGSSEDEDEDEDKYADAADAAGQKVDTKSRITVRNLRIREDTAKYLMNLDAESAHYDPKTRSMREAPVVGGRPEDMQFAGDNFLRYSGDATNIQKLQLFAWNSAARGNDVHLNANPTQGSILHKQFLEKKADLKDTTKVSILEKYGGEEHLKTLPRELLTGQTEDYVEYSRTGQVIKGRERAKPKSKYEEDVITGNHTTIWGSWYNLKSGQWGYACCHATLHGAYCTGATGLAASAEESNVKSLLAKAAAFSAPPPVAASIESTVGSPSLNSDPKGKGKASDSTTSNGASTGKDSAVPQFSKVRVGEGEVKLDKEKLERALEEERKRKQEAEEEQSGGGFSMAGRKKVKYNNASGNTNGDEVTEEQLEAYRLSRSHDADDPMAQLKGDELLPL